MGSRDYIKSGAGNFPGAIVAENSEYQFPWRSKHLKLFVIAVFIFGSPVILWRVEVVDSRKMRTTVAIVDEPQQDVLSYQPHDSVLCRSCIAVGEWNLLCRTRCSCEENHTLLHSMSGA